MCSKKTPTRPSLVHCLVKPMATHAIWHQTINDCGFSLKDGCSLRVRQRKICSHGSCMWLELYGVELCTRPVPWLHAFITAKVRRERCMKETFLSNNVEAQWVISTWPIRDCCRLAHRCRLKTGTKGQPVHKSTALQCTGVPVLLITLGCP